MEKTVLIVNGATGSGKSTFANVLIAHGYKVKIYSSIALAKHILSEYTEYDGRKTDAARKAMSLVKQALILMGNIPLKCVLSEMEDGFKKGDDILITDIREPGEIKKCKREVIKKGYRCYTILINNPIAEKNVLNNPNLDQQGDLSFNNYNYDYIVPNFSTIDVYYTNCISFAKLLVA